MEELKITKTYFLNYINGFAELSLNYVPDIGLVSLEEMQEAVKNRVSENLCTTVTQQLDYYAEEKIAVFSGISYNADIGFDICIEEEAHNINSIEEAFFLWGLTENELRADIS